MSALLIAVGALLVSIGWLFGRHDRQQRRVCDASHARTMAAINSERERLANRIVGLSAELHAAQTNFRELQSCNQKLALRAVLATSPLAECRNGN